MELLAATFLAHAFAAQSFGSGLGPIPGEERFQDLDESEGLTGGGNAGIGWTQIDGENFLQLQLNTDFSIGDIGVGLSVPLNLRLDEPDRFSIRDEDWDEPFDYFRVIRYLRYGRKRDPLYFRIGDLATQIGHGTIMSRYINNLDINTRRLGIELDVNTDYGGAETMIGDVGSVFSNKNGSRMVGFRGYVKPVSFADPESPWNIFAVGASWIADLNAPLVLAQDENGQNVAENGTLVAEETTSLGIFGIDAEAEVLNTDLLSIIPYTDLNFIDGAGQGFHLGTLITFKFPLIIDLQLPVRVEYRRFSNDYRPIYFSSFYEVERFDYVAEAQGVPKAQFIQNIGDGDGINGYFADAALDLVGILQLGAIYEDYSGGDPNAAVFLNVPALSIVQFKAFYTKTQIEDFSDFATLDERSYAVAEASFAVLYPLYFVARATRRWQFVENPEDPNVEPGYESIDQFQFGVQVQFEY